MPSHIPRSLEPYSKKELLEKREQQLRIAIAKGAPEAALYHAAEQIREAQLTVLKAKLELLRYEPPSDELSRRVSKIEKANELWLARAVGEIVSMYRPAQA